MKTIGIDIGSNTISIYVEGKGILIQEPSCVASDISTHEPILYGSAALNATKKTPGTLQITKPVFEGSITDFDTMALMLHGMFNYLGALKSNVLIALNGDLSEVQLGALNEMFLVAGANQVSKVAVSTACLLGSGVKPDDTKTRLSLDMGAGISEIGLTKGCITKFSHTIKYGCAKLDSAITEYIKNKYSAQIDENTAKSIRETVGSVHPSFDNGSMEFQAVHIVTGLPITCTISSKETLEAMSNIATYIAEYTGAIINSLQKDAQKKLRDEGILISGGASLTGGMVELLQNYISLPIKISQNPTKCIIDGLGTIIENQDILNILVSPLLS